MNKEQLLAALEAALIEKNHTKLEELAKQAVTDFPEDSFGYAYLVDYFLLEDPPNYPKAETCLVKAIEFDAANMNYMNKFADLKEEQGLYDDARILYLKILNQDPNNIPALTNLGLYELRVAGLHEQALEYFNKAAELDPENKVVQLHRAEACFEGDDLGEALVSVSKALTDEFDEATTLMLIKVLDALGDKPKAMKVYDKLIMECPEVAAYRFEFARRLYEAKVCGETIIQIQKGIELMGEAPVGLVFYQPMLKSLFILKRYNEALDLLNDLIEREDNNIDLYAQRANIHIATEKYAAAIEQYNKIIELLDDKNLDLEYRNRIGSLYVRLGKMDEAGAVYAVMLESDLTAADGNFGIGLIAFKKGDNATAYPLMKKAKLKGNKNAEQFIYDMMQNHLNEVRAGLLQKYKADADKNAASAFLKKVSGVLWQFDSMESEALKDQPNEVMDIINLSLQSFSMTYTDKGAVFVKSVQADGIIFKIVSESGNSVNLELTFLDGSKVMEATLALKDGILSFSEKEGESLNFKKVDLSAEIPLPIYEAYMRTMIPDEMEFLGDKAKPVIDTFFQLA